MDFLENVDEFWRRFSVGTGTLFQIVGVEGGPENCGCALPFFFKFKTIGAYVGFVE